MQKTVDKLLKDGTVDDLVKFLEKANIAYRNTSKPIISDDTYDLLEDKLRQIDPENAFLTKIGAVPQENKVKLPFWMGSLDKIRDDPKALDKWKADYKGNSLISDKLDGNSAMVCYDKSGNPTLYSRGDGVMGQNISHLIPFLKFPIFKAKDTPLVIRGELIISKDNWKIIHEAHPEYSNARNLVAGLLHKKSPDSSVAQYIEFLAYELIKTPSDASHPTPSESIQYIKDKGFKTVYTMLLSETELTVEKLTDTLILRRNQSPYDIDGIVVYNDKVHKLASGKNPKYAFAFKSMLTHTEAEVIVKEVTWNISKDGYYKPTVNFDTITLGGVNIQKATGFNASYIEKNKIGPGARIVIIRSGDVIPHILRVLAPAVSGTPSLPKNADEWEWNESHVDIMVKGENKTQEQKVKELEHFAKTLDIKFVAKGIIAKLVEAGYDTIPKFLKITKDDLLKIEGFKKVSAQKIATSIKHTYDTATCVDMMAASNIFGRGFGTRKLAAIIKELPDILKGKTPTFQEVSGVNGIAAIGARAFLTGLPRFFALMEEIPMRCRAETPAPPVAARPAASSSTASSAASTSSTSSTSSSSPTPAPSFKGMTIVFTGFRNKEWEKLIEAGEGKVSTSVSKNTKLVVAADPNENSGKIDKARELGVRVISKEKFQSEFRIK